MGLVDLKPVSILKVSNGNFKLSKSFFNGSHKFGRVSWQQLVISSSPSCQREYLLPHVRIIQIEGSAEFGQCNDVLHRAITSAKKQPCVLSLPAHPVCWTFQALIMSTPVLGASARTHSVRKGKGRVRSVQTNWMWQLTSRCIGCGPFAS